MMKMLALDRGVAYLLDQPAVLAPRLTVAFANLRMLSVFCTDIHFLGHSRCGPCILYRSDLYGRRLLFLLFGIYFRFAVPCFPKTYLVEAYRFSLFARRRATNLVRFLDDSFITFS